VNSLTVILIGAAVFLLDFVTKQIILRSMAPDQTIPVIKGFFHITFVRNPGAAFGLLPNQTSLFIIITLIVIAAILFYTGRFGHQRGILPLGLGLQLGGAVGNLLDRIQTGSVIDFFEIRPLPVFNVADVAIVSGVGLFILYLVIDTYRERKEGSDT
jgi:signal peptidase II